MALLIAFGILVVSVSLCVGLNVSIIWGLLTGLVAFMILSMVKGFRLPEILEMAAGGVRESAVVIESLLLIGVITGVWRACGTIAFFVYYGIAIMTPGLFIFISYLLSCAMSYIFGISFAVSGTLGVILIAIAQSGGVEPVFAAGAVMSGMYFGDRCSPASSGAILIANITDTNLMVNVKYMMKTAALPFGISLLLYAILSISNPLRKIDPAVVGALTAEYDLPIVVLLPALFILVLPLMKVDIRWAFLTSALSGLLLTVLIQGMSVRESLVCCVTGYAANEPLLSGIMNGGGIADMAEVSIIVVLACSFSGIFKGTAMLANIQSTLEYIMMKIGKFSVTLLLGALCCMVFCNQTFSCMLSCDLLKKPYQHLGGSDQELAIDIENSTVMISAVIPWCIACSVPLTVMDVGFGAVCHAYLLFLLPLSYFFTKKLWFKDKAVF